MLGSVHDAQDVVQEAFVRWMSIERSEIRSPEAFMRRTVTRLCLDLLKSARHQRETYLGPWLPDPVLDEEGDEDVTLPLMLALERLTPLERAAFLLHDVFGLSFNEIAQPSNATSPLAASSLRGPGPMFGKLGRGTRSRRNEGLRLPEPSTRPHVAVIWPLSARCSLRT
jgi:hypothetical protein